jgi:hypothetical protein
MALTLFVPPGKRPYPAVVLSHGRPGAAQRAGTAIHSPRHMFDALVFHR